MIACSASGECSIDSNQWDYIFPGRLADCGQRYFVDAIEAPYTFEQLRTASKGHILKPLVKSLSDRCHHPGIISALMYPTSRLFSHPSLYSTDPFSGSSSGTLLMRKKTIEVSSKPGDSRAKSSHGVF